MEELPRTERWPEIEATKPRSMRYRNRAWNMIVGTALWIALGGLLFIIGIIVLAVALVTWDGIVAHWKAIGLIIAAMAVIIYIIYQEDKAKEDR